MAAGVIHKKVGHLIKNEDAEIGGRGDWEIRKRMGEFERM